MREILFREKKLMNSKEWVYGDFLHGNEKKSLNDSIFVYDAETQSFNSHDILTETIGQYTGLIDKNGKKIFEGDIVLIKNDDDYYTVEFDECCFQVFSDSVCYVMDNFYKRDIEIIGNKFDNPELLR